MNSTIIALDDIRSHHNVGSIFRSADAFGITEVMLGGITPKPPHRDIQKSALGATESVPWTYNDILADRLLVLRNSGYKLLAIEQAPGSIPLHTLKREEEEDYCLILGNEVNGVHPKILELCDSIIEIPQVGMKKSLNVSVCAGIVMFYFNHGHHLLENV